MRTPKRALPLLSVFAASFIAVSPLWAQEEEPSVEAPPAATDTTAADRLEQTRQEMTVSLVRLEAVRQDLAERLEGLDQVRADLAAAEESGVVNASNASERMRSLVGGTRLSLSRAKTNAASIVSGAAMVA